MWTQCSLSLGDGEDGLERRAQVADDEHSSSGHPCSKLFSESFGDAGTHLLGDCGVTAVEDQLSTETPSGGEKQWQREEDEKQLWAAEGPQRLAGLSSQGGCS